jgi:hypothetical protein
MSTASITATAPHALADREEEVDRYEAVKQYSVAKILGVWAAAALPMGVLAWVIAPALKDNFSGAGDVPMFKALLLLLTAGMAWQFVLVALLIWHEQRTLRWSKVREALWLRSPRSPKTGRVGGKLWLILIPLVLLFAVEAVLPIFGVPENRDFATFVDSAVGKSFFSGAWGWFGVVIPHAALQHRSRRGAALPRPPSAAHEPCFRPRRLGCERRSVHGVPRAHALVDAGHAAHRHVRNRVPGEAVPERLDRDRRPRCPERVLCGAPLHVGSVRC